MQLRATPPAVALLFVASVALAQPYDPPAYYAKRTIAWVKDQVCEDTYNQGGPPQDSCSGAGPPCADNLCDYDGSTAAPAATDPVHVAWTDEIEPEIEGCYGHSPQAINVMTPDISHDGYEAQCPYKNDVGDVVCQVGVSGCCQLDMGTLGNAWDGCAIVSEQGEKVADGDEVNCVECTKGGGAPTNKECDMLNANYTDATKDHREYLDEDSQCAMWLAIGYQIDEDLANDKDLYAEDAADIIRDWIYKMKSVEIQYDEHKDKGNESALNTVSRLGGLLIAADLIWDYSGTGKLTDADKAKYKQWVDVVFFAALDRINAEGPNRGYGNQPACGYFSAFLGAFQKDDPALVDIWLNGGDMSDPPYNFPNVNGNGSNSTLVNGFYNFLDRSICPCNVTATDPSPLTWCECDLDFLSDHNFAALLGYDNGTGEEHQDSDREEATDGDGSEGAFYTHKWLQCFSGVAEIALNQLHLDLWHWISEDGSSLYFASKFLYNGTKMVCPDKYNNSNTPQDGCTSGSPPCADGYCDWKGPSTRQTDFCRDLYDNCTSCQQLSGNPDGLCDFDGATAAYCAEDGFSPFGFWGDQSPGSPPSSPCTFWRELQGASTPRTALMRAGWPFLYRVIAADVYNESWAHEDDVDYPIEAVSRVDDGPWRFPQGLKSMFGLRSGAHVSPCSWRGRDGPAGTCFTPCCEDLY